MPQILSLGTAVPPHVIPQNEIRDAALNHFSRGLRDSARLVTVFNNVNVKNRYMVVPLTWFERTRSFTETNNKYVEWAEKLSAEAIQQCLDPVGLKPSDIDQILFVSSSGLSTPSIDARLANSLGFKKHIKRTPIFGLGCAGGASGLSRAGDLAKSVPGQRVLLVAVELSSLTFQFQDFSKSNLVASSLFADGAAAVLVQTENGSTTGPQILATQSTIWPSTLHIMGWDFSETGLSVIFSRQIPKLIQQHIRENIDGFLKPQGLELSDIDHFIVHPGGAKIIVSFCETLQLPPERLEHSREVLENYGNMSSPTILFILERYCRVARPKKGEYGLCVAFGPGFCSELLLIRW